MRGAELLPAYVSGAGAGWHAGVAKLMAGAVALQQLDVGRGHLQQQQHNVPSSFFI